MFYNTKRYRRLRKNEAIRSMVSEVSLSINDFIVPLFVVEGKDVKEEIPSMPDYYRMSLDLLLKEVKEIEDIGLKSILIFAKCPEHLKDNEGKEAVNPNGLMQRTISSIKEKHPDLLIMSDIALDPYSKYGHDGIVDQGEIVNDKTVDVLAQVALSHARSGVDFVAPSDMMDGRVFKIRTSLDNEMFEQVGILSYSAKYASAFYSPFRSALDSKPGFGDKKTYQMNPANRLEAIRETELDIEEGADIVMIKPGMSYLDIVREVKNSINIPLAVYQVSGEYAMIKAAVQKGWLNERDIIMESLISIKRAGADLIATYFAKEAAKAF